MTIKAMYSNISWLAIQLDRHNLIVNNKVWLWVFILWATRSVIVKSNCYVAWKIGRCICNHIVESLAIFFRCSSWDLTTFMELSYMSSFYIALKCIKITPVELSLYRSERKSTHLWRKSFPLSGNTCTDYWTVYYKIHLTCDASLRHECIIRADSRFAPCQWETALLCNDVSHWLGEA